MFQLIPFVAIFMGCGIPMLAIWTAHQRKLLEMQMQMNNQGDSNLRASVEALREEIRSLRDTTMQYDLSFDTALQRMEQRVESVERRVQDGPAPQTVDLRGGR